MSITVSMRPIFHCLVLPLLLLGGPVGGALGQEDQSGAGSGLGANSGNVRPELDDAFVPIDERTMAGAERADVRDTTVAREPAGAVLALWEQLANLDAEQRANAEIELELSRDASGTDRATAAEIAALWNGGQCEEALVQLRALEESGVALGLGLAWRVPQAPGGLRLTDLRIGGTRADAQTVNLDFDAQNGNLFTVVRWGSTNGTSAWTINMSSNDGVTWSETYVYTSSVGLIDVDFAVVGDYVYVGYVVGNATADARLRRGLVSTGAIDALYGFQVVFDAGANTIEDVALAANADDYDNRIYYAVLQSNDAVRWAWDVASGGTSFEESSPVGANAEYGLDMTWDHNLGTCGEFIYISYAGNDGHIHVLGNDESTWTNWTVETDAGTFRNTAVSAYEDTIICAFEYPFTEGTGIRYRISYNCGTSWSPGTLAVPDGSTVFGYFEPDVDARDGDGTAIAYQAEAGELDPMYYRTRAGFAPGVWSEATYFSDHDVYTGSDTALGHIPPLAAELFSHGALYISLDPDERTLYFDRPGTSGAACDDTTPPVVNIDQPGSLACVCDAVQITGTVGDPDGTYVGDRLEYRRSGVDAWTVADTAIGARSGVLYVWNTSALPQDFYYVRVVGRNECALSASDSTFVYRSTSFGSVDLRSPTNGGIYGRVVCFDGTAWTQSCFEEYTVDYRPAGGGAWTPVDPPSSPYVTTVINDPLATWSTASGPTAVADGDYQLRLQGMTVCGDIAQQARLITIDNTAPVAEIADISNCDRLDGVIKIVGTAADAHLAGWVLQYVGGSATDWVTIASGNSSVVDDVLAVWDTTRLRPCAYVLRLTVTDASVLNCDSDSRHTLQIHRAVLVGDVCADVCRGDTNCDGQIDFADINSLVDALMGGVYCDGTGDNADVDGNGSPGFEDINPFVDLLMGGPLPILCP